MIVTKGYISSLECNVEPIKYSTGLGYSKTEAGPKRIEIALTNSTKLGFYVKENQEKKLDNLLGKAFKKSTRLVIEIKEG